LKARQRRKSRGGEKERFIDDILLSIRLYAGKTIFLPSRDRKGEGERKGRKIDVEQGKGGRGGERMLILILRNLL